MTKPCKQCPFRRTSLPGYLGEASYDPESFLQSIEHSPIPCHLTVNWEEKHPDVSKSPVCIGSLQFHKNSCKQPRNVEYGVMVMNSTKNKDVFNWKIEFIKHHKK